MKTTVLFISFFIFVFLYYVLTRSTPGGCSVPTYEPDEWTGIGMKTNNCMNYAKNDFDPSRKFKAGIGVESGQPAIIQGKNYDCKHLAKNFLAETPGAKTASATEVCGCNSYKVALMLDDRSKKNREFHFLRQDNNKTWSHKLGGLSPTNVDAGGNIIKDPHDADFNYKNFNRDYRTLCSYFCVPST